MLIVWRHDPAAEKPVQLLFLVFLLTPIAEMYLLIKVGGWIGALPTIGLVALTAMIGVALLRQQGFATLLRGQQRLAEGQLPAQEMMEGFALAVGGALLLTPGFVTDSFGFALLLPFTRRALVHWLLKRGTWQAYGSARGAGFHFEAHAERGGRARSGPQVFRAPDGAHVIEGEFEREDEDDDARGGQRGGQRLDH